ncbi:MAG: TetR/AcrR family transcriptional regulator [Paracoccus sp. BP8]|nr:MAG: TetR/AcrR family transcriptional regulator [Paracoccus sp. BP8]
MPTTPSDIAAISQAVSDAVTRRPPQQARSRRSQAKVLAAARRLLEEEGYEGLTLQKVSRQSGVSIGSIYGRFTGKDELMHAVQAVVMEELGLAHRSLLDPSRWTGVPLRQLVPQLFDGFADLLRQFAPILRQMMLRATQDAEISRVGTEAYQSFITQAMAVLMQCEGEVRREPRDEALRFALFAAFSIYRNHLGFGSDKGEMPDIEWAALKRQTNDMVISYLLG